MKDNSYAVMIAKLNDFLLAVHNAYFSLYPD